MKKKPNFYRFNDDQCLLKLVDYHIHTNFTDGKDSPETVIAKAKRLKLTSIAFTEHVRKESDYFSQFYKVIDALRQQESLEIFVGAETKVINRRGDLDISPQDADLAEVILGSVHRINKQGSLIAIGELTSEEAFQEEYQHSLGLIEGGKIDVLAHPAGMSLKAFNDFPIQYLSEIIRKIAQTQIAFELNLKYMRGDYLSQVIKFCRQYNPFISIGSDHHAHEIGSTIEVIKQITCSIF